jgi:hypothetical protein
MDRFDDDADSRERVAVERALRAIEADLDGIGPIDRWRRRVRTAEPRRAQRLGWSTFLIGLVILVAGLPWSVAASFAGFVAMVMGALVVVGYRHRGDVLARVGRSLHRFLADPVDAADRR